MKVLVHPLLQPCSFHVNIMMLHGVQTDRFATVFLAAVGRNGFATYPSSQQHELSHAISFVSLLALNHFVTFAMKVAFVPAAVSITSDFYAKSGTSIALDLPATCTLTSPYSL
jgi:hypothetical protein